MTEVEASTDEGNWLTIKTEKEHQMRFMLLIKTAVGRILIFYVEFLSHKRIFVFHSVDEMLIEKSSIYAWRYSHNFP